MLAWTKNGPLKTVWIAAHVERKLVRSQINEADISKIVNEILHTKEPYALRISAYLLLGAVRVYSRKVSHVLTLCEESVLKMKSALITKTTNIRQRQKKPCLLPSDVTIADHVLKDFLDPFLEHLEVNINQNSNIALPEQITLQQNHDYNRSSFLFELDERFPDGSLHLEFEFEERLNNITREEEIYPNGNVDPQADVEMEEHTIAQEIFEERFPEGNLHLQFKVNETRHTVALERKKSLDYAQERWHTIALEECIPERFANGLRVQLEVVENEHIIAREDHEVAEYTFEPRTPPPDKPSNHRMRVSHTISQAARDLIPQFNKASDNDKTNTNNEEDTDNMFAPLTPSTFNKRPRRTSVSRKRTRPGLDAHSVRKRQRLVFDMPTILSKEDRVASAEDLLRVQKRAPCTCREIFLTQKIALKTGLFSKLSLTGLCGNLDLEGLNIRNIFNSRNNVVIPQEETEERTIEGEVENNEYLENPGNELKGTDEGALETERDVQGNNCLEKEDNETWPETPIESDMGQWVEDDINTQAMDHSGWSTRTKAVAGYLKDRFKKSSNVKLEQVLRKSTRRGAACMFFNLLVLRSKDCVGLEQAAPFEDIVIMPKPRLMDL